MFGSSHSASIPRRRLNAGRTSAPNVCFFRNPMAVAGTGLPYDGPRSEWRQRIRQPTLEFLNVGNPLHRRRPGQAESRVTEDRVRPPTVTDGLDLLLCRAAGTDQVTAIRCQAGLHARPRAIYPHRTDNGVLAATSSDRMAKLQWVRRCIGWTAVQGDARTHQYRGIPP
jgi:hypothetical protein